MSTVVLKRDGFYRIKDVRNEETEEWEKHERLIDTKGEDSLRFLSLWNKNMIVEEGVLTGDLFRIMHQMDPAMLTMVELLTDSCWKENLKEAFDPVEPSDKEDESKLEFVEVYRILDVTNHGDLERFELDDDYTCAHGVGAAWKDFGGEDEKLTDEEKKAKGLNVWAIEFTPWNELRNVPLRIRPKMHFSKTVWKKGERRKMISNGGDEEWNFSDKDLDREKSENSEIDYSMTVGDFLCGIANELCFFGDPESRKAEHDVLKGRMDEVEETLKNEKN